VNLDLGKLVYAYQIEHDKDIAGTVVRTSTIPEELGRIEYLFTDKTGTITKNGISSSSSIHLQLDMELKKLHVGTVSYGTDSMEEVEQMILLGDSAPNAHLPSPMSSQRGRREIGGRVKDAVLALAVCHNVTPIQPDNEPDPVQYQAASPDEVAIVQWCASVGVHLEHRDRQTMALTTSNGDILAYNILKLFPFTSESKRMGIVVRAENGEIWFFMKGADTVMQKLVIANDWMEEECANMAREGLRTLVIGRRRLTEELWTEFDASFQLADTQLADRDAAKAAVVAQYLEHGLEILGITGVEDKLQDEVKASLELLRNAGIRIWMLTGDKIETARCVAISSKLVGRGQYIHSVTRGIHLFLRSLILSNCQTWSTRRTRVPQK
jgi:phospholipid-translocating ATPase